MTEPASHVLRPGIRTYKPRRSRISQRQSTAIRDHGGMLLALGERPLDPELTWGPGIPVVLEIGFGTGRTTAQMAAAEPDVGLLAIDVHTPGIGDLLYRIDDLRLVNVRVMEADALAVLEHMIPSASLAGVRSYFPDPWPKPRHHKRRLVQPEVLALVADRLTPGGYWHIATDWEEYAASMVACFADADSWQGGVIPRPERRPVTRYEGHALREGRTITDLLFHTQHTR